MTTGPSAEQPDDKVGCVLRMDAAAESGGLCAKPAVFSGALTQRWSGSGILAVGVQAELDPGRFLSMLNIFTRK